MKRLVSFHPIQTEIASRFVMAAPALDCKWSSAETQTALAQVQNGEMPVPEARENRLQRGAAAPKLETFPRGKLKGLNSPLPWARVRRDGALPCASRTTLPSRHGKKEINFFSREEVYGVGVTNDEELKLEAIEASH